MPDFDWRILLVIGAVLLWVILNLFILPKLGIRT